MNPYGGPQPGFGAVYGQQPLAQKNKKAQIAFYLALACIPTFGLTSAVAIVFGILALKEIKASHVPVGNSWMAIAALVFGAINLLVDLAVSVSLLPMWL